MGRDLRYEMSIAFEEAVLGKETEISIHRMEVCIDCSGTGTRNKQGPSDLRPAPGDAARSADQQDSSRSRRHATSAAAPGTIITNPCPTCRGEARVRAARQDRGGVPAGVEEGDAFATRAKATPAASVARMATSSSFFQSGHGVLSAMARTASRDADLRAPGGAGRRAQHPDTRGRDHQNSRGRRADKVSDRGKGVPHLNERGRGDLVVQVVGQTPRKLTKVQRELLRQLAERR